MVRLVSKTKRGIHKVNFGWFEKQPFDKEQVDFLPVDLNLRVEILSGR